MDGNTGTRTGGFMKIDNSVRSAGMSGAFTAVGEDVGALGHNPAGIAGFYEPAYSSTYSSYIAGTSYSNLSAILPVADSAVGISVDYFSAGSIQETTAANPFGTGRNIAPNDYSVTATFARDVLPWLSLGLSGRVIGENIDASSTSGYGADLGIISRLLK